MKQASAKTDGKNKTGTMASKQADQGAERTGNNGFVDTSGNRIEFDEFDDVSPFQEGLAAARKGAMEGYINKKGEVVIPLRFFDADGFSLGLARVDIGAGSDRKGDRISKYGFIDKRGEFAIKPQFDFAYPFSHGVSIVEKHTKQGAIDVSGRQIIPYQFVFLFLRNDFENGVVFAREFEAYQRGDRKVGLLDLRGKWIVEPVFDGVGEFSEGMAAVELNGTWGYVDSHGRQAIEPRYEWAGRFSEGLAPVRAAGKYGYIEKDGNTAISFLFEDALPFTFSRAVVQLKNKVGYLDERGNFAIEPRFKRAGMFHSIS